MKPLLHTEAGLALAGIAIGGAVAIGVLVVKIVRYGCRSFDQAADVVFGR